MPAIEKIDAGDDVPIPTFPFGSIVNAVRVEVANVVGDEVEK